MPRPGTRTQTDGYHTHSHSHTKVARLAASAPLNSLGLFTFEVYLFQDPVHRLFEIVAGPVDSQARTHACDTRTVTHTTHTHTHTRKSHTRNKRAQTHPHTQGALAAFLLILWVTAGSFTALIGDPVYGALVKVVDNCLPVGGTSQHFSAPLLEPGAAN